MVDWEAEDPLTGTTWDPVGNPTGTVAKFVMITAGFAMTLLAFGIAQQDVVPRVSNVLQSLLGVDTGSGSDVIDFGGD